MILETTVIRQLSRMRRETQGDSMGEQLEQRKCRPTAWEGMAKCMGCTLNCG